MLTLDHVIIRVADPATTLVTLSERAGLPVLADATRVGGITSAIARAGAIDIELLAIGRRPPAKPQGYGLGFVADRPLDAAIAAVRANGLATSSAVSARAHDRRWRAAQVAGLLPDPFPIPTTARAYGAADRMTERVGSLLNAIPGVAQAATRKPGRSMVVLTEYGFDADALRATRPRGPEVVEVHVGTGGNAENWERFPLVRPSLVRLHDEGPAGVTRIVFSTTDETAAASFSCGDVAFEFRHVSEPAAA